MRRQRWVLQRHCSGSFTATAVGRATIRQGISLSSLTSLEAAAAKPATRIRGRVETTRIRGKIAFIHLRQPPCHSIQVVASAADIVRRVKELTPESIIDATGTLVPAERPVTSASCKNYELHAERVDVVSRAATPLPFPIKDCNTRLDTRLNHRVMDMRTPLTASVLRLVSAHVRACLCLCSRTAGPMDHGKTNKRAASHRTHGMNERMHFCDGVFLPPLVVVFSLARVFSPSPPIRQRPPRAHVEGHIRVHIYLSVSVYIYRGNKDSVGGKLIRRSLVSRNGRTTCLQFGTGRCGAPLSLMNLRPHRPGVRDSAPFISAAGASHNSHYPNGLQNETPFAFAVGEDPHHISSPWAGVTTELGERSAFVACPPFNRISQPVTPAAPLQRAGVIATDTTALLRMRTGTTTPSAAKRSGASQGTGDCIMALIHNRANEVGVALCLFSSLAVIITQYGDSVAFAKTLSFVFSRNPVEVLVPETALDGNFVQTLLRHFRHITFAGVQRGTFDEARGAHRLFELMSTDEACLEVGNTDRYLCVAAANALVEFLEMNYNCTLLPHTVRVQYLALENYVEVSPIAARGLHLIASGPPPRAQSGGQRQDDSVGCGYKKRSTRKTLFRGPRERRQSAPMLSLVDVLNHTMTIVGGRLLRSTILQPLRDPTSIELRYDCVEWLRQEEETLKALRRSLQLLGNNDIERAVSNFSHEPKVQTLKTMQQRIEAVVTLWQLLGSATQLTTTLRNCLREDEGALKDREHDGPRSHDCCLSSDSGRYDVNEGDAYCSFRDEQPCPKRRRLDESCQSPQGASPAHNHGVAAEAPAVALRTRRDTTTLLCKILETLTECRMEEICAEIALHLDEGVLRATSGVGPQVGDRVTQRACRPSSAISQVQHCFAVKPNISGTLDIARQQYSQAIEAIFALAEELKQRYSVCSLHVVYDGVRGYRFSYDARHERNAPDAVFLQKYSGGSHDSLYHSSRMTMVREEEKQTNTMEKSGGGGGSGYGVGRAHAVATGSVSPLREKYPSTRQERFRPTYSHDAATLTPGEKSGSNSEHQLTKHQVRGRRVTCTTNGLLVLCRNAEDAVAEIFYTQDGHVRFLIEYLRQRLGKLQAVCDAVALLDMLTAFAVYSRRNGCVRPKLLKPERPLVSGGGTYFLEARHICGLATANSIQWGDDARVLLVTGPNAAGKTTILRQVGQLFALAQIGCLVPAKAAAVRPCDRIIAHMLCDDLEDTTTSSFGKEMRELSYLCLHATQESVVLVDELGRRTSAREGAAIAWATVEFLVETRCRSVFVTHFGPLTRLENLSAGAVKNYHLAVGTEIDEEGGALGDATKTSGRPACTPRFEHRLMPGPSQVDHYGLRLAERVGFFKPALDLAKELLPLMEGVRGAQQVGNTDHDAAAPEAEEAGRDERVEVLSDGRNRGEPGESGDAHDNASQPTEVSARFAGATDLSSITAVSDESDTTETMRNFYLNQ